MVNIIEKVTWTVCPQGVTDKGDIQVSLFVAPRLSTDAGAARLDAWTKSWLDWPHVLADLDLAVNVFPGASTTPVPIKPNNDWRAPFNSRVYVALFDPHKTKVLPHKFTDLSHRTLVSYPVAKMAGMLEATYIALGMNADGDSLPSPQDLLSPKNPLPGKAGQTLPGFPRGNDGRLDNASVLKKLQSQGGLSALTAGASSLGDLAPLFSFYHQPLLTPQDHSFTPDHRRDGRGGREKAKWPGYKRPASPDAQRQADDIDFHRIAAAVGNYAQLARMCGLVIDLTIPVAKLRAIMPQGGPCAVAATVGRAGATDVLPRTLCTFTGSLLAARPKTGGMYAGRYLNMKGGGFDFVQMDVDGAAHKAIALGASLGRMKASDYDDDDFLKDNETAPDAEIGASSLRSAGIMLAKSLRHEDVAQRTARSAELNSHIDDATPVVPDLYAEDLQRGYRIDVRDRDRWQSLNRRIVDYRFLKPDSIDKATMDKFGWNVDKNAIVGTSPEEEGLVTLALGSSPDGSAPNVSTLHEGLFVWRGWSLSAPEPVNSLRTKPLDTPPDATPQEQHTAMVGPTTGEAVDGLPLQAGFRAAPKSLPALRFGRTYQVRVRSVDLTGGSAPWTDGDSAGSPSPPVTYRRYEPLESPVLTLIGKGEQLRPKVPGLPTELPPPPPDYPVTSRPMQGESMGRMALRTYFEDPDKALPASKEGKVQRNVAPARVTQRFAEAHGAIDTNGRPNQTENMYEMLGKLDQPFDGIDLPRAGDTSGETTRYTVASGTFELPYLPDPYAVGIAVRLRTLEDKGWSVPLFVPLYGDTYHPDAALYGSTAHPDMIPAWPRTRPLRIVGTDDPAAKFGFDTTQGMITIPMPKACRQRVRLSSVMPDLAIENMALWAMIKQTMAKNNMSSDRIHTLIQDGQHWMFTPWREIEFVHATQRPLVRPVLKLSQSRLKLGDVDAVVELQTPLGSASTVRLDLKALWHEPEDNDTLLDAKAGPVDRLHQQVVIQQPIARKECLAGQYPMRDVLHHFPDTRYRRVLYSMDALSRFREFFAADIADNEDMQKVSTLKDAKQWVLNSAAPPAPHVAYVIPTFGWFRDTAQPLPGSKRTGGLRVYLERPWLATGYNEMLAVLLPNIGDPTVPDDPEASNDAAPNRPFVTQWGRDPIRLSTDITTNSPKRTAFRLARFQGPIASPNSGLPANEGSDVPAGPFKVTGLKVPGQPSSRYYSVAPHEVGYDSDRQMWYADIAVNIPSGSYFPFLRLAVARYQPFSLDGAHLSSAATCDFVQISPDRIAVIVPMGDGKRFEVFLFGDQPQDGTKPEEARIGDVVFQSQVLDAKADPVLGWRDADPVPQVGVAMKEVPDPNIASQAASRAAWLASQPIGNTPSKPKPGTPQASATMQQSAQVQISANGPGVQQMYVAPNLIAKHVFTAGPAPAGGKRRLLIVEQEVMKNHVGDGKNDSGDISRVVYAEGIEF